MIAFGLHLSKLFKLFTVTKFNIVLEPLVFWKWFEAVKKVFPSGALPKDIFFFCKLYLLRITKIRTAILNITRIKLIVTELLISSLSLNKFANGRILI